MRASAPGKLMLAGEYAVLSGGPAVVMAVNRRAVADARNGARGGLAESLIDCAPSPYHAQAVRDSIADSSALCAAAGVKLGLGSSAAVMTAVAARAVALVEGALALPVVIEWARRGHAGLQGRRGAAGSGVDVIASATGGVIEAFASGAYRPLELPEGLRFSYVWTGHAADTVSLIKGVAAFGRSAPREHAERLQALAEAAQALVRAFEDNDAAAAIFALALGRKALGELGRAARLPLELEVHRELNNLAYAHGGVARPTGAGGGDVAVCAFTSAADQSAFEAALAMRAQTPLSLALDPAGVTVR